MYINKFKLHKDSEYVQLSMVGVNSKTGEETLRNVGYTRGFLEALEMLTRKMSVVSLEQKDLKAAMVTIKEQHKEIKDIANNFIKACGQLNE